MRWIGRVTSSEEGPMNVPEPREGPTADELLDRWRTLSEKGTHLTLEAITHGASERVRGEVAQRIADIQAAQEALNDLWCVEGEAVIPFYPRGAPGRYVDPKCLDRGGMGLLCVASDAELKRKVAYKVMEPRYRDDPAMREQFLNEAAITAKLRHPGIVPIFGLVNDDAELPAYAMELVDAPSLTDAIENYFAIDVRSTEARREARVKLLRHFVATCRIVAYAHKERVVHGDIKPLNILVDDKFGATWLVDWGLARTVRDDENQTEGRPRDSPTAYLGTGPFRGPSFRDGTPATFASDIHALGVTLALILAEPHSNPTPTTEAAALHPARDTPLALWAIARKARHSERARRYVSANALADDVENALNDQPVSAYRDPWFTIARRWLGRHRTATTAGGLSALIVVIGITSLALISAAHDREALKAIEAARYHEEALQNKADGYLTYATYAETIIRKPTGSPAQIASGESVRSLLRVLEQRDQDPKTVSETAHAVLEVLVKADKVEAEKREVALKTVDVKLREGISVFEELTRLSPTKRSYRVLLGRYYQLFGAVESNRLTNLVGFEALLAGRGSVAPQPRAKLEATLALFDKALATLPPDGDDVHQDWFNSWLGRATALTQLGRFTEALLAWDQAVAFADGPEKAQISSLRSVILKGAEVEQSHMPWSRPPRVDHAKAMRMAEELANHEGVSPAAVYNAACAFSLASLDATADAGERRRRADRAMTYLQRIAVNGYFRPRAKGILSTKDTLHELLSDHDLDPLRGRPDFKALAARAAAEAGEPSAMSPSPAPARN
jgi:tRNA A-37 threonylcarbamoyl transferase component Bud32/tetratricopeptide (TPR) repeat protein